MAGTGQPRGERAAARPVAAPGRAGASAGAGAGADPQPYVAVVGAAEPTEAQAQAAMEAGARLAAAGAVVVTGGGGGVMAAASRGAAQAGGTVVGVLPGATRAAANPWVSVALATGLGELRNGLIVRTADAVLAVGGAYGTLSEVALALATGVPVVGIDTWAIEGIEPAPDPAHAVERVLALAAGSDGGRA